MRKLLKFIAFGLILIIVPFVMISCGYCESKIAEKVSLAKTILGEVEFENGENVELKQDCDEVVISGKIDSMSLAEASEFGKEDVSHVVVLKFEFDKEKTISFFEIKGEITKVYSVDSDEENYVGSISDLLDSEADEDAYCYLILSANTKEYKLTSKYSDDTLSTITVKIEATLVSSEAE